MSWLPALLLTLKKYLSCACGRCVSFQCRENVCMNKAAWDYNEVRCSIIFVVVVLFYVVFPLVAQICAVVVFFHGRHLSHLDKLAFLVFSLRDQCRLCFAFSRRSCILQWLRPCCFYSLAIVFSVSLLLFTQPGADGLQVTHLPSIRRRCLPRLSETR